MGCGEEVMKKNHRFHMLYHCLKRPVVCPQCGQEVGAGDLEAHLRPPRVLGHDFVVACPLTIHRNSLVSQYEVDFELEPCPLCEEPIPACRQEVHMRKDCEFRLVGCRNRGCSRMLPLNRRTQHEELYCSSPDLQRRLTQIAAGRKNGYARHWAENARIQVATQSEPEDDD
uniref:TRAF-type domain-containing protein n=1 Tax=Octactis speculum TaxID=3111310 RepID=A0A7S2AS97_9STRA